MNWRTLYTIALKDLKEVMQNRAAWMPAVFVPLFFTVLLPLAVVLLPTLFPSACSPPLDVLLSKRGLPPFMAERFAGLNGQQLWVVLITGFFLAPLFLIIPLMFASIVGADSFVGERERQTLEALLYTPSSDGELFLGKVLASIAPALALTWLNFLIYTVVVNAASWRVMGCIWFPTAPWWPLMFWVTPAVATLGTVVTVLISSRVRTFMEANQLTGSLVLLILALVAGQVTGVLYLSTGVALLIGLGLWVVDGVLLILAVRTFSRDRLISRL